LTIHLISPEGEYSTLKLGREVDENEYPQAVVMAGYLFAVEVNDPGSYVLAGCTVSPGFDFADFEMPSRGVLLSEYPQHYDIIECLTRE
jgi:predicted cupin superfamily sugar epimerase